MKLFSRYSEILLFFNVLLSCTVLSQGIRKDVGFSINLSKGKGMVVFEHCQTHRLHFLVLFLTLILVHYATVFLNSKNQDTLNENYFSLFHLITSSRWAGSAAVSFTSVSLCCLVYTTDPRYMYQTVYISGCLQRWSGDLSCSVSTGPIIFSKKHHSNPCSLNKVYTTIVLRTCNT